MKLNKLLTSFVVFIGCLFFVVASFGVLLFMRVKKEYTVEFGETLSAEDFRRFSWDKGNFIWIEQPDLSSIGEKQGKIQVYPITYQVTVFVTDQNADVIVTQQPTVVPDTTAPIVTTRKVVIFAEDYIAEGVLPEDFIEDIVEESEYQIEVVSRPGIDEFGNQKYQFIVKDSFGNSTNVEAEIFILNLKKAMTLEVGSEFPSASEFLYVPTGEASFVTDISTGSALSVGTYEITLLVDGQEAVTTLQIQDTMAPDLVLAPVEGWLNKPLEASCFVNAEESKDNSNAFEVEYVTEPDWSIEGEQTVSITAVDASGNSVTEETTLIIKKDTKAPVVSVTNIDVKVGGTVSYKKAVSYYDDVDSKDEMNLTIERSEVNLKEIGTYQATYTVTDCSGNSTSVIGKINVLKESPAWEDEDAIHAKAQGILDSILKDDMTDREKAKAIYKWIRSNIGYINFSEKGNYTRGAYEGLFKHQGDCFVFASASKELLTLAGLQNIDVIKSTGTHYWNLVYVEDGWYHFDATPRKDKSTFFLLTDAELEAYSKTHQNTHIFDRSLYPKIK